MADPQRPPSAVLTPARCATPAALYLEPLRHSLTHTLWSARAEAVALRSPRLPLWQRLCGMVADRALKNRDLRLAVRLRTCEMTRRTRRHVLTGWSGRERDVHPSAGAAVRLVSLIVLVSLAAVGCSPTEPVPPSASLEDNVTTTEPGRTLVTGTTSREALVTLEPTMPYEYPLPGEPAVMDQVGLEFTPSVLLVQVGQNVEFRNSEDVLHNVRVQENQTQTVLMNVAIPSFRKYEYSFERPGFHTVSCDVHPAMRARILVTATPFAVIAGSDGRFTLPNVPPGSYTLTILAGGHQIERVVEISGEQTTLAFDP